jgi:TadE-like protein
MKRGITTIRSHRARQGGQALVEFAIAITVFLVLLLGIVDVGRAIYQYNGVSQAAREIARTTSVHPGTDFTQTSSQSPETVAVIHTQQSLVPNLGTPVFSCVDIAGNPISTGCVPGDFVRVAITAPFTPAAPILGLIGTWNLSSTSTAKLQGGNNAP